MLVSDFRDSVKLGWAELHTTSGNRTISSALGPINESFGHFVFEYPAMDNFKDTHPWCLLVRCYATTFGDALIPVSRQSMIRMVNRCTAGWRVRVTGDLGEEGGGGGCILLGIFPKCRLIKALIRSRSLHPFRQSFVRQAKVIKNWISFQNRRCPDWYCNTHLGQLILRVSPI